MASLTLEGKGGSFFSHALHEPSLQLLLLANSARQQVGWVLRLGSLRGGGAGLCVLAPPPDPRCCAWAARGEAGPGCVS